MGLRTISRVAPDRADGRARRGAQSRAARATKPFPRFPGLARPACYPAAKARVLAATNPERRPGRASFAPAVDARSQAARDVTIRGCSAWAEACQRARQ